MILVKDFIRKYGNETKYIVGFSAVHSKQLYAPNPKHWHIKQITGDEALLITYENDQELTKKIYLQDFIEDWYIEL